MKWPGRALAFGSLAALGFLAACGGKTEAPLTPTASETAAPSAAATTAAATAASVTAPTATPTADNTIPGIQPISLRAGDPVPLPAEIALYAFDPVWEGPSGALRRYYRNPSGVMRTDDLVVSRYTDSQATSRAVVGAVSTPGGGVLAVGLCHGFCYGGWLPVTVVRSSDGGVTWEEVGTVAEGSWGTVVAVTGEGVLVRGVTGERFASTFTLPASAPQQTVAFPAEVGPNAPMMTGYLDGKLAVVALGPDRRALLNLDGSGTVFARVPEPPGAQVPYWSVDLVPNRSGLEVHVEWSGASGTRYLGIADAGEQQYRAVYSYRQADGLAGVRVTEWLSDTVAIGRVDFDAARYVTVPAGEWFRGVPAIIDFETGVASPIAEFVRFLVGKAGGPAPVVVARGPFARVALGAGECLNLRDAPGITGRAIGCAAGGTLLTFASRQTETSEGGVRWLKVATPGGVIGWAATTYLEY